MPSVLRLENQIAQSALRSKIISQSALVLAGVAVFAASAQVKIPLPFTPVPLTGQTFAVFLLAGVLGFRLSLITSLAYLGLGFLGLPVFAGAGAGFNYASLSFGYLWGFVAATAVMGLFASKGWNRSLPGLLLGLLAANVALYIPGITWMGILKGFDQPLLAWGLFPFIIGDLIKIALSLAIMSSARRLIHTP